MTHIGGEVILATRCWTALVIADVTSAIGAGQIARAASQNRIPPPGSAAEFRSAASVTLATMKSGGVDLMYASALSVLVFGMTVMSGSSSARISNSLSAISPLPITIRTVWAICRLRPPSESAA